MTATTVHLQPGDTLTVVADAPTVAPPEPTPIPPQPTPAGALYGMGICGDTLANTNVTTGSNPLYARFRAEQSAPLAGLTFYYLGPPDPGYAAGTGGTIALELWTDATRLPGTKLATLATLPPTGGGNGGRTVTFASPPSLVKGSLYHVLWRNVDADPKANFCAVDFWYCWESQSSPVDGQYLPRFPNSDWAHGYWTGSAWVERARFTPILDLAYANGVHQGQSYGEASYAAGQVGRITGSSMARERIVVSGADRTVGRVGIRLLRETGADPLRLDVMQGATALATAVVPAASIAVGPPWSSGGTERVRTGGASRWVEAALDKAVTLKVGTTYDLRLSSGSATVYWAWVNRRLGTGYHYDKATYFADGVAQKTTDGATWTSLGRSANENDLQFYLR